ncbi:hypothetical protein C1X05_05805 [Laceyella sacchari]|nr:hypothetical protein [Laceyella tengchongensis]AUS08389.1 hypothetical protein C1X05_05805 [Laceyella sacchari]MRG26836.1 hypothetical protein [Laceyella tengchongensis]
MLCETMRLYLSRIYCQDCDRFVTRHHCQTVMPRMGQVHQCPHCHDQKKRVIRYWRTQMIDDVEEMGRMLSCTPFNHAEVQQIEVGTITVSRYERRE